MAEGFEEQALRGLTGNNGGTGFAACEQGLAGIDAQSTGLGIGVAGVAVLLEDGADAVLKEILWERLCMESEGEEVEKREEAH